MLLRKKKKKGLSCQVDYIVSVLEIKPWPPSVALCSVQAVLIQWENGEQNTRFLPPGVPSLNGFDDGKIEFNDFFKLPVTLTCKSQGFQKNNLEFHLYEPKKDKAVKGKLLGTATVHLADYGIIKHSQTIITPILIKKVSKGSAQPLLYVQIQPFDNEGIESLLRMMSEHCDDDSELTFLSDDDVSTSRTPTAFHGASVFQIDESLNFVNVGSNSDLGAAETQENGKNDGRARRSLENGVKEKKEQAQGVDDWGSGRKSSDRDNVFSRFSELATTRKIRKKPSRTTSTLKFGKKGLDLHGFGDKLQHIKSVQLSTDSQALSLLCSSLTSQKNCKRGTG